MEERLWKINKLVCCDNLEVVEERGQYEFRQRVLL